MSNYGLTESELNKMRKTMSNLMVIDLRRKDEFAKGHIKGSVLVEFDVDDLIKSVSGKVVVIVSSKGEQSEKITNILRSKNTESYFLIGGIKGWTRGLYCTNIAYVGTNYP